MNNLWNRVQMLKLHYGMGAIDRSTYVGVLNILFEEARNGKPQR